MNAGEFVLMADLSCRSCDFTAEDSGEAMVHALTIGHTVSGQTPAGDTVTISTEPIED
jgi:hypothetical protein